MQSQRIRTAIALCALVASLAIPLVWTMTGGASEAFSEGVNLTSVPVPLSASVALFCLFIIFTTDDLGD